jgi:ATP-dependent Zn protease
MESLSSGLTKYYCTFEDLQEFISKIENVQGNNEVPIRVDVKRTQYDKKVNPTFYDTLTMKRNKVLFTVMCLSGLFLVLKKGFSYAQKDMLGKSAKNYELIKDLKVKFDDVAGMKLPKQELTEFVEFLKNSSKFDHLGAVMPKGALMTGPPGVGKTFLAKAVAGEAGVSFFYVSGTSLI